MSNTEIAFADGVPIPPAVRPVIVLSGSDYDIGYQWFRQYVQIFGPWILEDLQCSLDDEELSALKAFEECIKRQTPECIEIMKGMADGATDAGVSLSYDEVLACFAREEAIIGTVPAGSETVGMAAGCSGFAAWGSTTKDGKLLCVGVGDYAEVKFEVTIIAFPANGEGNSFVLSPYTVNGKPSHPGMNDKGLVYVHHGAGTSGNERPWSASLDNRGVPNMFGVMHTLRFANHAEQALALQSAYEGHTGGLWADTSGDAFCLECRDPLTVRRPGDAGETDYLYVTNNIITESEELEKFIKRHPTLATRYVPHAGYLADESTISSIPRNLGMWNMLHNYQGCVDLDFVKMMCRFPGDSPDYPTLEEADAAYYETRGAGWDQKICDLATEMVGIMVPDERTCHVSSFCVARISNAHHPGGHYYPVGQTYSFFQLKLAGSPADAVLAAKERGRYDLYYANQELRKLTYWDVPYAPLNDIFNKAATEWIKGDYYSKKAEKTEGSESVCNHGKALRAFSRCQAYANQVYESLVPPPVDPTALGHPPYSFAW
jgi:hypothetical protein